MFSLFFYFYWSQHFSYSENAISTSGEIFVFGFSEHTPWAMAWSYYRKLKSQRIKMNKTKSNLLWKLSAVVLMILIVLLVWDGCNQKAQLSAYKKQIGKLSLSNQKFSVKVGKDGKKIIEQEQLILSQKDALRNNLLVIEKMRNVKSQVRIESVLRIDSVIVPYTDTFIVKETGYKEFGFGLNAEHYKISGKTKANGIMIDSISFPNESRITIGNKSRGLFRSSQPVVEIVNSNPFIETKSVQNVVIKNEIKWWDRKGTWFAFGLIGGVVGGIFLMK